MTDPAFESKYQTCQRCNGTGMQRVDRPAVEPEVAHLAAQVELQAQEIEGLCVDLARWRKLAREYETLATNAGLL